MIKAAFLGFLCFLLFFAAHIVVFRTFTLKERFRALTIIFYSMIPVYIFIYMLVPADYMVLVPTQPVAPIFALETIYMLSAVVNFIGGLMFYIFLFLGYCQFYFIVDRSISVRVMIEIDKAPEQRLSFDDIMLVYSFKGILARRLEHMVESDYVVKNGGHYENTPKGRVEARVFNFIKEFLKLGPGG